MRNAIYLGLVHSPVYNKRGDVVCTSVTNFDIHDISRTCRTYGVNQYHIIVSVDAQKKLTERIIGYWQEGFGADYNKDREEAFERTRVYESIERSVEEIKKREGKAPKIITTSAKIFSNSIDYNALSDMILNDDEPYLILFGTGWGLIDEVMQKSDYILKPIRGKSEYNHLSVRSAVSIILDRLIGEN